jgi:hypothetical protein
VVARERLDPPGGVGDSPAGVAFVRYLAGGLPENFAEFEKWSLQVGSRTGTLLPAAPGPPTGNLGLPATSSRRRALDDAKAMSLEELSGGCRLVVSPASPPGTPRRLGRARRRPMPVRAVGPTRRGCGRFAAAPSGRR